MLNKNKMELIKDRIKLRKIMSDAHITAKTLIGDYSTRLKMALLFVWSKAKKSVNKVSKYMLSIGKKKFVLDYTDHEDLFSEAMERIGDVMGKQALYNLYNAKWFKMDYIVRQLQCRRKVKITDKINLIPKI